jgi:adenylate cyclase, class 2
MPLNIEIKAYCHQPDRVRQYLLEQGVDFKGLDVQTDTYFEVPHGRLKLRQGNIENNLIAYQRDNLQGPKSSSFQLAPVTDSAALLQVLQHTLGIKVVVKKQREIYCLSNVKFHIDHIEGLGHFVEIEAGNLLANHLTAEHLQEQCNFYMEALKIAPGDCCTHSYSDMLLGAQQ